MLLHCMAVFKYFPCTPCPAPLQKIHAWIQFINWKYSIFGLIKFTSLSCLSQETFNQQTIQVTPFCKQERKCGIKRTFYTVLAKLIFQCHPADQLQSRPHLFIIGHRPSYPKILCLQSKETLKIILAIWVPLKWQEQICVWKINLWRA